MAARPPEHSTSAMFGDSEMARRVLAFDWSRTALGPLEGWPPTLRVAVSICLGSRFPMMLGWGPDLIGIYNDAYIPMMGPRHPDALGISARESWRDVWSQIGSQAEQVLAGGEATWNERANLQMEVDGTTIDTWFTWSYSAVRNEAGRVAGILCVAMEDTTRVTLEQQRDRLAEDQRHAQARDRFLLGIEDAIRPLAEPEQIMLTAATLLGRHLGVDRCAYAEIESDQDTMHITGNYRRSDEVRSIVGTWKFTEFGAEVLRLMREDRPYVVADVDAHVPQPESLYAYRATQIQAVVCVPLHKHGRFVAAMAVHTTTPRTWTAEDVELVQMVANRCWESLERARVTRSLQESESRFRALVHAGSDIVYCMSPDWSSVHRLQGRGIYGDTDAGRGISWYDTYIPEEDQALLAEAIARAMHTRTPLEVEHRARRLDGSIGWIFSRAVPILDERGEIREWFGAASDVTARHEAAETLRASEAALKDADRRKDEFLAMLAHELRNPLAPLSNALHALRMSEDPETSRYAKDVMERQIRNMVRLVDDLLDVSRITRGKVELRREVVSLSEVIESALETIRPLVDQRGQTLRTSIPHGVWLDADKARLSQVFANILNNASKFTSSDGVIEIHAEQNEDSVTVDVSDTGIGIPPDRLSSVFELFSQVDSSIDRSQGGLGIGLTVVRTLLEMHGGSVEALSEGVGKGCTFRVTLPTRPESRPSAPTVADARLVGRRLRLLVVDDNRDSAETLGMMLELLGHEVRREYDGAAAVEAALADTPDVVFLDLGMPGMNGFEVCRRIKSDRRCSGTVIVAQTGWGDVDQRTRSGDAGFDEHLVKPVDMATLERVLAAISSAG